MEYAVLVSSRERAGASIDASTTQIAAISRSRGATLATRNVKDFQGVGIELLDPCV
jgi:predicted nucleic acid-binding protein